MRDGVVRWRRRDLQHRIKTEFGVVLHERSAGQATGGTGLPAVVRAPAAPEVGPGIARSVQKNFPAAVAVAIPARAQGKPLEIWFQDEARVGQQGTLTRVWARRGSRPRALRDTRYQWSYIFGAVCPGRATAVGLVLPFANTEAMNAHLAEIARTVAQGDHAVLVLDGAGWHGAKALTIPDNISLLHVPPYAPGQSRLA